MPIFHVPIMANTHIQQLRSPLRVIVARIDEVNSICSTTPATIKVEQVRVTVRQSDTPKDDVLWLNDLGGFDNLLGNRMLAVLLVEPRGHEACIVSCAVCRLNRTGE